MGVTFFNPFTKARPTTSAPMIKMRLCRDMVWTRKIALPLVVDPSEIPGRSLTYFCESCQKSYHDAALKSLITCNLGCSKPGKGWDEAKRKS
jgi:hypothetical protein